MKLNCLDFPSLRKEETKENFEGYQQALGLYISFLNNQNNNGLVFRVNNTEKTHMIQENGEEVITQVFLLQVEKPGSYDFWSILGDNFGVNYTEKIQIKAE